MDIVGERCPPHTTAHAEIDLPAANDYIHCTGYRAPALFQVPRDAPKMWETADTVG